MDSVRDISIKVFLTGTVSNYSFGLTDFWSGREGFKDACARPPKWPEFNFAPKPPKFGRGRHLGGKCAK